VQEEMVKESSGTGDKGECFRSRVKYSLRLSNLGKPGPHRLVIEDVRQ